MTLLDWAIPALFFVILLGFALHARQFGRSVAGFLVGNRCAGRYLLCVSHAASQVGVITLVWSFQQNYDVGFTSIWWAFVENPVMILIALTGWVLYRFRETRALTLAQFLETRYSQNFRIFCGIVAFAAGVLNYAIFPAVTARFLIALTGLPAESFPWLMAILLTTAVTFVFLGGQVTVMVCDFLQGVFCNIVFLIVIAYLMIAIGWGRMEWMLLEQPAGHSMVNPLAIEKESQFNVVFWLISAFTILYTMKAWQGGAAYNAAALTPHEAKMSFVLEGWRWRVLLLVALVIPIAVKTLMMHPDFAASATVVQNHLTSAEPTQHALLRVPYALSVMLPAGLLGLMVAAMYGSYLAVDNTYLHSWASIGVQDVLMPIRSRFTAQPWSPAVHVGLIKGAVVLVAIFAWVFGMNFESKQYIAMWATITGAVFVAGAGSVIIGGLYWKRGTTAAAWAAMIVGITCSLYAIVTKEGIAAPFLVFLQGGPFEWVERGTLALQNNRWMTSQILFFITAMLAVTTYISISLLFRKPDFDLDRMLFRGRWRELLPESERAHREEFVSRRPRWLERLGFTREFSRTDTIITWITMAWPLFWTAVFVVGTLLGYLLKPSDQVWTQFWGWYTWAIFVAGCAVVIWFTIGGVRDLLRMYA